MGIRSLRSFIDNNSDLIHQHKLHDTKVVIDGTNFVFFAYKMSAMEYPNHRFGGDYITYAKIIRKCIKAFRKCRIEPIFVFDGGIDRSLRKMSTIFKRLRARLTHCQNALKVGSEIGFILPILSKIVFTSILIEMEVKFVQSFEEADTDVAMLANHYQCPVISDDSDFFIFDLNSGFVELNSIDFRTVRRSSVKNGRSFFFLDCRFFDIQNFLNHFPGLDRKMLPLFSTIMGNDYVEQRCFINILNSIPAVESKKGLKVGRRHYSMIRLLDWMRHKNVKQAVDFLLTFLKKEDRKNAIELIEFSKESYEKGNRASILVNYLEGCEMIPESFGDPYLEKKLPPWFLDKFSRAQIDSLFINIFLSKRVLLMPQVDDLTIQSSYQASHHLQIYLYSMLMFDSKKMVLLVHDRKDTNYVKTILKLDQSNQMMTIDEFQSMTVDERKNALLQLIWSSESDLLHLKNLLTNQTISASAVDELSIVILLVQYWIKRVRSTYRECLMSILACILYNFFVEYDSSAIDLSATDVEQIRSNLSKFDQEPFINHAHTFKVRITHHYNQLQTIFLFFSHIQSIFDSGFSKIQPHHIFQGSTIYNLCCDLFRRADPQLYINVLFGRQSYLSHTFNCLLNFVESSNVLERYGRGK
ncbi:single-strand DNA endonuclease protein asteroid [Brevipalpus obovatus]|uniref:single-strand DNA endonuclease protein asteroid n=1 Tax=Brevipalpus obovatus TaxID=246614 RepID=UPI003D9E1F3B